MNLLAAHYDRKRAYKSHCKLTESVRSQSRYKYNPDWSLEGAKCALRNGKLSDAIRLADGTIADQQNMASSSKGPRLLVAYKIKARARTTLYDSDAKKNAGFGDERLLNYAIMAWEETRNYARGISDSRTIDEATREIGDLEERRAPK